MSWDVAAALGLQGFASSIPSAQLLSFKDHDETMMDVPSVQPEVSGGAP